MGEREIEIDRAGEADSDREKKKGTGGVRRRGKERGSGREGDRHREEADSDREKERGDGRVNQH